MQDFKEKIKKYYSQEEYVTISSSTGDELLDIINPISVLYTLRIKATQRFIAMCELIRASSFKFSEWKEWYAKYLRDDISEEELGDYITEFNISIIKIEDGRINAIKNFANYYKAMLMAEITIKEEDKKEQFLNDYSRYLCLDELLKFYSFVDKGRLDDNIFNYTQQLKNIFHELFYAQDIKQVAIEKELLLMLNDKRFRESSLTLKDFEGRNPFESDYFRIVTSAPIRRLQDKTQIFPQEKSDFVRRRLTHSMEVAAVGRQLGLMVEEKLIESGALFKDQEYAKRYSHAMAAILETAGLVHDIGNPPFGHFGEDTIQQYFKNLISKVQNQENIQAQIKALKIKRTSEGKKKIEVLMATLTKATEKPIDKIAEHFNALQPEQKEDFTNFDGNVQGLRILRHLGLSADHSSFNLTMPTMAAIIKYPFPAKHDKITNNHSSDKCGYYQSEKESYEDICKILHMRPGKRHPLAYLLEAADDIVNVTSDVEDGYKMGIISFDDLRKKINRLQIKDLHFKTIKEYEEKQASNDMCSVAISNELLVKEFRIRAVHKLMDEAVNIFVSNIHDIISDSYDNGKKDLNIKNKILGNELLQDSSLRNALSDLQFQTYHDRHVLKSELLGEHVITTILDKFIGCMFSDAIKEEVNNGEKKYILNSKSADGKLYALISSNYKRAFDCEENEVPAEPYQRFLLAVDHVSGMTDSYIVDLYNELTNRKR